MYVLRFSVCFFKQTCLAGCRLDAEEGDWLNSLLHCTALLGPCSDRRFLTTLTTVMVMVVLMTCGMMYVQLTDAKDSVARGVLRNFVELCLFNIAQTDTQTVAEAVRSFDASAETRSVFSPHIVRLINRLISLACPGQPACSGRDHGQCVSSVCVCTDGRPVHLGFAQFTHILICLSST